MVRIRPAVPADLDSLVALLQILFGIEEDFAGDHDRQRHGLELMLENKRGCVLVAEAAGEVVGMCTGQVTISTAEGGPALLVEDVVVQKEWRSRGVGRLLMEAVSGWAGVHNISRLQLLADRNNGPALGFYANLGWQGTALVCLRKNLIPR